MTRSKSVLLTSLILVILSAALTGCSPEPKAITPSEAERQNAITQQGIANGPAPGAAGAAAAQNARTQQGVTNGTAPARTGN